MPSRRHSYSLVPSRPRAGLLSCFSTRGAVNETSSTIATSSYASLEDDVIGISLVNETAAQQKQDGVMLGLVTVPRGCNMPVSSFRNCLVTQLPALPVSFCFLTSNRWPVLIHQEAGLQLKHITDENGVVLIQRFYDKPRIGVKTRNGAAIGFIFCEYSCCLSTVRNHIFDQLGQVVSPGETNPSYQFLDSNHWPVAGEQESHMTCLDILCTDCTISICSEVFSSEEMPALSSDECSTPPTTGRAVVLRNGRKKSGELRSYNTVPLLRTPTFRTGKDLDRHSLSVDGSDSHGRLHQMLISYVRAEAAQHALELKKALTAEGFAVYLDVHEIKTGIDWQDALNYAVSNCEMFVPLVTPRYGETQWTNREVKLADYLGKFIVPVSFLDYWPPPCLAIQFATTQFVPYDCVKKSDTDSDNTQESSSSPNKTAAPSTTVSHNGTEVDMKRSSMKDMKMWDWRQIKSVAKEIGERYRVQLRQLQARPLRLTRRPSSLRTRPVAGAINRVSASSFTLEKQEEQPLIVLSAHPNQKEYAQSLRDFIEKEGFEVWCSHENEEDVQFRSDEFRMIVGSQTQSSQDDGLIPSQLSSASEEAGDNQLRRLIFQQKADDAAVVIFILSKDFAKSKTSQQQVFYCEHRKRVVPLKYEDFSMPGWMSMLIGTSTFEDSRCEGYRESLIARMRNYLDPSFDPAELNEAKINRDVGLLRKAIPQGESMCIYVSGSTKFYYDRSEAICKAIGENLARLDFVTIVTGGFYGVGDLMARSFLEARLVKPCDSVWHVLPRKDEKDCRHQARQNTDRTFQRVPYGKTVFSGDSVRDRETIISRVIDVCLLIEGGPGAAHEAEQFAWNDRHVIPVRSTGGAAGGKFNVPEKIFEIPQGVNPEDWALLDSKTASPSDIGQAVAKIVSCLRMTVKLCQDDLNASVKKRKRTSTKNKSVRASLGSCKTFVLREKD